jgi:hypothetical protein
MSFDRRAGFIVAWVISLVLVGIFASAQVPQTPPVQPPLNAPTVLAGNDLGFRMENMQNGIPVGKLVVRISGRWVEAQLGGGAVVPVEKR